MLTLANSRSMFFWISILWIRRVTSDDDNDDADDNSDEDEDDIDDDDVSRSRPGHATLRDDVTTTVGLGTTLASREEAFVQAEIVWAIIASVLVTLVVCFVIYVCLRMKLYRKLFRLDAAKKETTNPNSYAPNEAGYAEVNEHTMSRGSLCLTRLPWIPEAISRAGSADQPVSPPPPPPPRESADGEQECSSSEGDLTQNNGSGKDVSSAGGETHNSMGGKEGSSAGVETQKNGENRVSCCAGVDRQNSGGKKECGGSMDETQNSAGNTEGNNTGGETQNSGSDEIVFEENLLYALYKERELEEFENEQTQDEQCQIHRQSTRDLKP